MEANHDSFRDDERTVVVSVKCYQVCKFVYLGTRTTTTTTIIIIPATWNRFDMTKEQNRHSQSSQSSQLLQSLQSLQSSRSSRKHIVTIRDQPVYLQEDWNHGIGGGLWSTGLALAKYLDTSHAQEQLEHNSIRTALELGSGNGFLAVCLSAAYPSLQQLVVTDTAEHISLMQSTMDTNASLTSWTSSASLIHKAQINIQEYLWGTGSLQQTFDLILGSDVAYRDELHDPLIQALLECSHSKTITLLGVTMNDTKPIFFTKLIQHGFQYERIADHCMDPSFRGTNFGIFVIQRTNSL